MQNIITEKNKPAEEQVDQSEMFVTFTINDDIYGISVLKVQEIIGVIPVIHMPNSVDYLKGIINLRGKVLPVIDMRIRFRMETRKADISTVILIVEVNGSSMGLLVDSVSDVLNIPSNLIHDYSKGENGIRSSFVKSIANFNENLILLLDINEILSFEEMSLLDEKEAV